MSNGGRIDGGRDRGRMSLRGATNPDSVKRRKTMLFALALEFGDYALLALLIVVLTGGGAAATAYLRPADRERLRRIEHKLDLILTHLGIEYVAPARAAWQQLADDPVQKIAAVKAYREEKGVGLAEAKKAVEDYVEGRGK